MTRILLCFLAMNLLLVYGYLGITYNLQDCTEIPPIHFCGRSARANPPLVFYFYHPTTGQCEPFLWSDCPNAHSNNVFPKKDQCEAICRDPLTVPGVADSEAPGRG